MRQLRTRLGHFFVIAALCCGTLLVTQTSSASAAPAPPEPPAERLLFTPIVPARLLDTRPTEPTIDGQGRPGLPVGPRSSISLSVVGRGGVPATGVAAVVLNVTATNATAESFITVSPTGATRPTASNLNTVAGATAPNLVIAKVGAGGKVDLYNHAGRVDLIADVSGYFPTTDTFVPLVPQRLLDTRPGEPTIDGLTGSRVPLRANSSIDLKVVGRAGVPSTNVDAVVLNVTATNPTTDSFLTVFPKGTTRPTASNLNPAAGTTVPNLVIAKVGRGGAVSIYNRNGTTDVIADIAGYFPTGGAFVSVPPARIYETRPGEPVTPGGTNSGVSFQAKTSLDVDVAGIAGVPAEFISAVVLNVTAVGAQTDSFITVHPTGSEKPNASNLNLRAQQGARPNLVVSKVGAGGKVTVFNKAGATDVVVDVAGYFLTEYGGIRDIDLSERSSCVLFTVGSMACWGDTAQDSTVVYDADQVRPDPYDLNTFDDVVDMTADFVHSCALRVGGAVWCWSSQTVWPLAGPNTQNSSTWPARRIQLPRSAVEVDSGFLQTCALLDDGAVWCWGRDFANTARPTAWRVANLSDVIEVEVGDYHGCALKANGTVACWGTVNEYGTLGNGSGVNSPTSAVPVAGLTDADSISVQSLRACATRETGEAACWGLTTGPSGFSSVPTAVLARTDGIDAPADDIWQMVGGDDYVCALRFDDQVYCYGSDFQQDAGLGGPVGGPPDILTEPVLGLPPIAFLSAGRFNMCAVSYDDEVYCWGHNDHGQIGDGTLQSAPEPVLIISFDA